MLRPVAAKVAADCEPNSYQQRYLAIDVARLIILPESEDSDGRQQRRQRGALRHVLVHFEAVHEDGDHDHAAADPY